MRRGARGRLQTRGVRKSGLAFLIFAGVTIGAAGALAFGAALERFGPPSDPAAATAIAGSTPNGPRFPAPKVIVRDGPAEPVLVQDSAPARATGAATPFSPREVRVIDGDTFEFRGETVRIADVDTPEKAPRARCESEAALAEAATRSLRAMVSRASTIELRVLTSRPRDRYGRLLAEVSLDGVDVGDALVAQGVARPWRGRREPWC